MRIRSFWKPKNKLRGFPLLILLLFCLSVARQLFAQTTADIPVEIKADKLKYYESSGQVEAIGSAEVKLKGIAIRADRITMDSATNVATAEGNVQLFANNYQAQSRRLTYDTNNESSRFADFSAQLLASKVNGQLYVNAAELTDKGQEMTGRQGAVTTCDERQPHFFLRAARVNYYPEQRIEGWNNTVYVGQAPVFWLPYFYYDLSTDRRRNWNFGHNNVEGNFIKTFWAIPAGLLLLDYMDKKGLGYGLQTDFQSRFGLGNLSLYHIDERDTRLADWVEKITNRTQLDDKTTLDLRQSYISTYQLPSGRMDQTNFGLTLNRNDRTRWNVNLDTLEDRSSNYSKCTLGLGLGAGSLSANYNFNYDFTKTSPNWFHNSQRLNIQGTVLNNVGLSFSTNYYRSANDTNDPGEEKAEPTLQLNGSTPAFSWRFNQNWFIDLKRELYPGNPRYEYLEKSPELEISPRAVDLGIATLTSTLGYGKYHEVKYVPALGRKRDYTAERLRATFDARKSIPLQLGSTLTLALGLDQYVYSPGDQLFALRESAGLQTNLGNCFRNDINFNQGYTAGNTPLFFDQVNTRYHDLREKLMFYYLSIFNWTVDGGYNWQTNKYYDVLSRMVYSPQKELSLSLTSGWDIENRLYKDLLAGLFIAPVDFYALNLSFIQDLNGPGLKTASAMHDLYILKGAPNQLRLQVTQSFDPIARDHKIRTIALVKDLHCWEMRYNYSDYLKQFSLSFSLKALPGEPVSYSTGRGFYYEGIERQLNELNPQMEIRRY